jgi:Pseudouridine synthase II TruB, C-terminal
LRQGQKVPVPGDRKQLAQGSEVAIVDEGGQLLAIALIDAEGNLRPAKVLVS